MSAALKCKRANQSVSFASSHRGLTTTRLCSIGTLAIFSDFRHFQAGSVYFELIMVKRWVWGTFKSDAHYSASFEGDLCSVPFQNQTLKSVTLWSGLNCLPVLINLTRNQTQPKSPSLLLTLMYKETCLFYEWSETQVKAAALWSVGFSMYQIFHWVTLTSCIYHSKAYCRPSVCFYLKLLFGFSKNYTIFLQGVQLVTAWAPC